MAWSWNHMSRADCCGAWFGYTTLWVSPGPNPSGVTVGLPSSAAATKPPCRCVIIRTWRPSGVSLVSTGIQDG
jgi:hypothetical protein